MIRQFAILAMVAAVLMATARVGAETHGAPDATAADSSSVVVKYTYLDDPNLDGQVDLNDYNIWCYNFLNTTESRARQVQDVPQVLPLDFEGDIDIEGLQFLGEGNNQGWAPAGIIPIATGSSAGSAPVPLDAKTAVVATAGGGRLAGTVVSMDSGGSLRLTGPQFQGEVSVKASAVTALTLQSAVEPLGTDEVVLVTGDRLLGVLKAVSADELLFETHSASPLKIPLKAVRAVNRAASSDLLADSSFMFGKLDPWKAAASSAALWGFDGGVLVSRAAMGQQAILYAKIDLKESLTFEARIEATGSPMVAQLSLCDANPENGPLNGTYVFGSVQNSPGVISFNIGDTHGSSGTGMGAQGIDTSKNILRLTYDPASGQFTFQYGTQQPMQRVAQQRVGQGACAVLAVTGPARVEYVRVQRGITSGAAKDDPGDGPPEGILVEFINKDRVTATAIALADGQATLQTAVGEIKCEAKSVARLLFGKKDRTTVMVHEKAGQAFGAFGRLTLDLDRLTADELIGRSPVLGEVHLRRAALRNLSFPNAQ
jgi:hypothetical protein